MSDHHPEALKYASRLINRTSSVPPQRELPLGDQWPVILGDSDAEDANAFYSMDELHDTEELADVAALAAQDMLASVFSEAIRAERERVINVMCEAMQTCYVCGCGVVDDETAPYCADTCEGDSVDHPPLTEYLAAAIRKEG